MKSCLLASTLGSSLALASGGGEAKAGGHGAAKETSAADSTKITNHYVQQWVRMPSWQARQLRNEGTLNFAPKAGEMSLVIFTASWCIPCQELMPAFKAMATRFRGRGARVYYVFAYDTLADAKDFADHHQLPDDAVLANVELMKVFNQPEIPAIFAGDRHGWLVKQVKKPDAPALKTLADFIAKNSAL